MSLCLLDLSTFLSCVPYSDSPERNLRITSTAMSTSEVDSALSNLGLGCVLRFIFPLTAAHWVILLFNSNFHSLLAYSQIIIFIVLLNFMFSLYNSSNSKAAARFLMRLTDVMLLKVYSPLTTCLIPLSSSKIQNHTFTMSIHSVIVCLDAWAGEARRRHQTSWCRMKKKMKKWIY